MITWACAQVPLVAITSVKVTILLVSNGNFFVVNRLWQVCRMVFLHVVNVGGMSQSSGFCLPIMLACRIAVTVLLIDGLIFDSNTER